MRSAQKRRLAAATWPERAVAIAVFGSIALTILFIAGLASAQAQSRFPDGVPDVLSPRSPAEWRAVQVGNVDGNPDFPVIVFVNTTGAQPAAVMMALDAQNGTDRWSLASDPVVLIALFADPNTITRLYFDTAFGQTGRPSGQYAEVDQPNLEGLTTLLYSMTQAHDSADQPSETQAQVIPKAPSDQ
jgi:hypothetical protein